MADLSKIKVGDSLKVEYRVTEIHGNYMTCRMVSNVDTYLHLLDGPALEAAEHIPAPRVFKRGDWVKEADDSGSEGRRGFVNYIGGGGKVFVAWPDCSALCAHDSTDLEPDEAPE